jgi:hypothetical protein
MEVPVPEPTNGETEFAVQAEPPLTKILNTQSEPAVKASSGKTEYAHLLSYFKYLVTLTGAFLAVMVAVAGVLFYSNLKDVREDAKQEATRVATTEAKARVSEAFDEKNINALILEAAQRRVGTISDKLIEQQLGTRLVPIEQRIAVIGQISECDMRMRMGFRSGLDDLNKIIKTTTDSDSARFGKATLATVTENYETRVQESIKQNGQKGMQNLQTYFLKLGRPQISVPSNLRMVVQTISNDNDLNAVAAAFAAFRDLTGADAKMFDFAAVAKWCSQNQGKCESP